MALYRGYGAPTPMPRPVIPEQPQLPRIHPKTVPYRQFAQAAKLAQSRTRLGVWRLNAYIVQDAYLVGDRRRGYYYGVVGKQIFEGKRLRDVYNHMVQYCLDTQRAKLNHDSWAFAIAPRWELAAFRKTIMMDALE